MTDDQAAPADTLRTIAEAETIDEAIRLAVGAMLEPGTHWHQSTTMLTEALIDRIYEEPDQALVRRRDHEQARENRLDRFEERRVALELAVAHFRDSSSIDVPATAETFHDVLTGVAAGPLAEVRARREPTSPDLANPSKAIHRHGTDTVYREGNRIRNSAGVGYADAVSDRQIEQHITRLDPGDVDYYLSVAFLRAVLAIRAYESETLP